MMPACRTCQADLIPGPGGNWSPGREAKNNRQCRACGVKCSTAWKKANPGAARRIAKRAKQSPLGRFHQSKAEAKRRKKEWFLTFEQWDSIRVLPCHYCRRGIDDTDSTLGSWCDRIDNRSGYAYHNVVPCCGECNATRGDRYTFEEMLNFIGPAIRAAHEARRVKAVLRSGAGGSRPFPGQVVA